MSLSFFVSIYTTFQMTYSLHFFHIFFSIDIFFRYLDKINKQLEQISYHIMYSRRKTIGIIIDRDGRVIVKAPYFTPKRHIVSFVTSKEEWIRRNVEKRKNIIHLGNEQLTDNSNILFSGDSYHLSIIQSNKNDVAIKDDTLEIKTKNIDGNYISRLVDKWYKEEALTLFADKMKECISHHPEYDFRPSSLSVKKMRSRWGSCSKDGKITLNVALVKIDNKYLEYVILHELCHLKEMNHSDKFYKILSAICPDYQTIRKEMRRYSCV